MKRPAVGDMLKWPVSSQLQGTAMEIILSRTDLSEASLHGRARVGASEPKHEDMMNGALTMVHWMAPISRYARMVSAPDN